MAVTADVPAARVERALLLALLPDKLTAPPKFTPLVWNCTVPVRVPTPGDTALTVAVNVTAWPNTDGFTEEPTVVVVLAWFTVCVNVPEAFVLKLTSPLYTAVI